MTDLAPHLSAFLQEYLPNVRRCSRHTLQSYTECFRLLVPYAAEQVKTRPCELKIEHFTGALLLAFLNSLEQDRNNSVSTRNVRLATIKSFFRYLEHRVPSCLNLALQVRALPRKAADKPLIDWLDHTEMQAIPGRAGSHNGCGSARPGNAASLLCRRLARVRADNIDHGQLIRSPARNDPHPGQGAPRTRTATVEGNEDGASKVA